MEKLDEARAREERKRKAMKAKRQAAMAKSATKTAAPSKPVFVAAPPLASPEPPPAQARPVAKTGQGTAGSKTSGSKAPAAKAPAAKAPAAKAPEPKAPPAAKAPSPETQLKSRQEAEAEISALLDAREQRARRRLGLSFLLVVIVPTLVAAFYLAFLATPRYLAEAKFIVRGTLEMLGGESTRFSRDLSSLSSISNNQEGHILVDHVDSHAAVERLLERMDLYAMYRIRRQTPESAPAQDPAFNRLMAAWRSMVHIGMDSVTGILTLDVQAYTAEDAMAIAQGLLDESSKLVNELTARARQDRLKRATEEVELSRAELDGLLKQFEAFRNQQGTVDANYSALALEGLAGLLRDQRSKLNAELTTARASMGDDASPTRTLKTRLESLDGEIANLEAQIDGTTRRSSLERAAVPQSLATQEKLETKRNLVIARVSRAEGAQSTALSDTLRQHAFLMIFEPPFLPHVATFPRVRLDTLITFLVMFGFWCIGATFTRNLHVHS
ncbi:hypothetical protein [Ancylobacter defluvii]|uniref:Capsular polysaccharide transport system permease protein n=1 Tax=Ancylobacter defluvii TaxID=1282440 RepID=A0A9W6JVH8_9HYPH|nr:hypothetical protein [Ancylobacter defluvii]MBS7588647.1 hypothetical protein [Ancylobacter defluvii]GLK83927.1 hypothetical protein GCM10017653_19970 [Ancylobacter defluvii]